MAQSMRDKIRSATVGSQAKFKTEIFEYQGFEVEFRQPNLKDRKKLIANATGEDGKFNMIEFLVWAVILNTYVPGTKEKIYDQSDYDSFMEQNTGGFVDLFGDHISKLMSVDENEGDVKK